MSTEHPPANARAACRLGPAQALVHDGLCTLAHWSGWWRHPAVASGDLADMTFLDRVYWLYKSSHPVQRPVRGSGLAEHFAVQRAPTALPDGFTPAARVRLSAVGDLMDNVYLAGSSELFREVDELVFDSDLAFGNFEGVAQPASARIDLGGLNSAPPLGISPRAMDVLTRGATRSFDFLSTASNHSLDFGEGGVLATLEALRARGIAQHGMNEHDDDASRATVLERSGVRVAVISHTFGTNGLAAPRHRPRIVNHTRLNRSLADVDLSLVRAQLAHAASVGADFVVAQLHWGMEFELYPRPAQLEVAHELAELGVDLVLGHHPHVVQPVEHYRVRRDPDRVVPIYYSLGNLTNPFTIDFMARSGVARVELACGTTRDGARRTYVRSAELELVRQVTDRARRTLELQRMRPAPA